MPRKQGCSHAGEAEEHGCVPIGLEAGAARLPNSLKQATETTSCAVGESSKAFV